MESPTAFWRPTLVPIANSYSLDPFLVEAIIHVESGGKADAFRYEPEFFRRYLSRKEEWRYSNPRRISSSYGLMQIMYIVAHELGFRDEPEALFMPRTNIHWGCRKLRDLRGWAETFAVPHTIALMSALAAYNGGMGGNSPTGPLRPENQRYATKVLGVRQGLIDQMAS